ncbi:hypothetical protein RchiOBHm_Chr4g0385361 [Rosa chinensis]|uniref:Uncharacterized protein n=1 Tax=Rosa chinensis TaxID=74649 RepID=A0A2P6QNZ0_ROSCH|nr:hypothetical protein RchiOBHm_Chr4g0385361 [Rosa chinensis]
MVSSEVISALANPVLGVLLVGFFVKVTPIAQDILKDWKHTNEDIVEDCREQMRMRGMTLKVQK